MATSVPCEVSEQVKVFQIDSGAKLAFEGCERFLIVGRPVNSYANLILSKRTKLSKYNGLDYTACSKRAAGFCEGNIERLFRPGS